MAAAREHALIAAASSLLLRAKHQFSLKPSVMKKIFESSRSRKKQGKQSLL